MEFDGTLYGEEITREKLISTLKEKFSNEQVRYWFSDHWKVFNERCIISPDNSEHRPDRVIYDGNETIVIDFKFGSPSPKHHEQVQGYINLLCQMGMPNVHGFLWYVNSSEIISVNQ